MKDCKENIKVGIALAQSNFGTNNVELNDKMNNTSKLILFLSYRVSRQKCRIAHFLFSLYLCSWQSNQIEPHYLSRVETRILNAQEERYNWRKKYETLLICISFLLVSIFIFIPDSHFFKSTLICVQQMVSWLSGWKISSDLKTIKNQEQ